jgi:hypothetical protein
MPLGKLVCSCLEMPLESQLPTLKCLSAMPYMAAVMRHIVTLHQSDILIAPVRARDFQHCGSDFPSGSEPCTATLRQPAAPPRVRA